MRHIHRVFLLGLLATCFSRAVSAEETQATDEHGIEASATQEDSQDRSYRGPGFNFKYVREEVGCRILPNGRKISRYIWRWVQVR